MPLINVENLIKPLSDAAPCGENLRYDARYLELDRKAEGTASDQFGTEAAEPNWREIRDIGIELSARGKHLKIIVLMTLAAVRQEGYIGIRDGLKVLETLLTIYWEPVFPQLDAEDNNDPTERLMSLSPLYTPMATFGDKLRFLDRLQEAPLCESRLVGSFSLRDIAIAGGKIALTADEEKSGRAKPTMDLIEGAFQDTDKEVLETLATAAEEAQASAEAIDKIFNDKLGNSKGPNFEPIRTLLKDAGSQIRRRIPGPDGVVSPSDPATSTSSGPAAPSIAGTVNSTGDAVRAMERIITYYEKAEPSSPVPIIINCARLMANRNFLDIVGVLDPAAIDILKRISTPPASPPAA